MKSVEIQIGEVKKTISTRDSLEYIRSLLTQEQIDLAIKKAEWDRKEKALHDPILILVHLMRENLPFSEESKMVRMIVEGLLYKTESTYQEVLQGKL